MGTDQLSLQCDCTPVADCRYDSAADATPTEAVVRAIAAASDLDPTTFTPLHEYIDTEALDRLFDEERGDDGRSRRVLGFTVNGWNLFVRDDGRIRVCDPSGPAGTSPIFD